MSEARSDRAWLVLGPALIVFLSNGSIMVLELVAGRLVSRYLGMSLYTWTAIIGLILAGMSIGNFVGGWIADRYRPRRALAVAFLLSAAAAAATLPLNTFAGGLDPLFGLAWPVRIFLHIAVVFVVPAGLLGVINPLVAKMALEQGFATGRTIGLVFAAGAGGSILGTFVTGYYLVFLLGVTQIILSMAAILAALGAFFVIISLRGTPKARPIAAIPRKAIWSNLFSDFGPRATVFVSNAGFMILEIAASRVISKQFGASLYTWTTVIGVVLAGVTAGNYLGGWIADRYPSRRSLSALFGAASVLTVLSGLLGRVFGSEWDMYYQTLVLSWPAQIFLFTTFAFFLPCVFMGTISPMVVKLCLIEERAEGEVVGGIYAWGTVGSIVGTFAAGYFLIDWFGMLPVIMLVAVALAATSWTYRPRNVALAGWLVASVVFLILMWIRPPVAPGTVYQEESNYSFIAVSEQSEQPGVRSMVLDKLTHSRVDLNRPDRLLYAYEWIYDAVLRAHFGSDKPLDALVIGGGGFTFPRYLEVTRPDSRIDVAEIDPAVTEAAYEAFGLPRDTSMQIYNMDARNFVTDRLSSMSESGDDEGYDVIFGDSINDFAVPYHLTTVEFVEDIRALLKPEGLYMLNLIDVYDSGRFLAAAIQTCATQFQHVSVMSTYSSNSDRDTFVVAASDKPIIDMLVRAHLDRYPQFEGRILESGEIQQLIERSRGLILTDNYAPVENLLAPVVNTRRLDPALLRLQLAQRWEARGNLRRAIAHAEKAFRTDPDWKPIQAYLAQLYEEVGDEEQAKAMRDRLSSEP